MRKLTLRETVMVGLLVAAGAIALYSLGGGSVTERLLGEPLPEASEGEAPVVDMASLQQGAELYDPDGRSLFKYYTPPRETRRRGPPPPPPKPPPRIPPRSTANQPPPVRTARPPTPSFDYIGFLGPKESKIAVFEDSEGMELVRSGDVVRTHFRVVEFKYDSVVIGYVDEKFRGQTTELRAKNR